VLAGADFSHGIECLAVGRQVHAREQGMHHAGLIHVHDEFLVAHRQAAFEPARHMQHEVHTRQAARQQRIGRLECRLRIRDLGST